MEAWPLTCHDKCHPSLAQVDALAELASAVCGLQQFLPDAPQVRMLLALQPMCLLTEPFQTLNESALQGAGCRRFTWPSAGRVCIGTPCGSV